MGGGGGVLHDAVGFAGASCKENVQDGWERGTDDLAAVFTVRWRVLRSAALQFPYQTVMQLVSTLSMVAPVECVEDGWWETCSFQPAEKV